MAAKIKKGDRVVVLTAKNHMKIISLAPEVI